MNNFHQISRSIELYALRVEIPNTWNGRMERLTIQAANDAELDSWLNALNRAFTACFYFNRSYYLGGCFCGEVEYEIRGPMVLSIICHCDDCSFHQGASQNCMFNEGSFKVVKGKDKVTTFNKYGITLRARCTECGTYMFARALKFGLIGTPYDHLKYLPASAGEPPKRPVLEPIAFHVNYHAKRLVFRDRLTKFNDFPTGFGGTGGITDDDGNIIANDKDEKKDA